MAARPVADAIGTTNAAAAAAAGTVIPKAVRRLRSAAGKSVAAKDAAAVVRGAVTKTMTTAAAVAVATAAGSVTPRAIRRPRSAVGKAAAVHGPTMTTMTIAAADARVAGASS
jgi:hypothetical protein